MEIQNFVTAKALIQKYLVPPSEIAKAAGDLSISDLTNSGGLLQPQQAKEILALAVEESEFVKVTGMIPMEGQTVVRDKGRFASRILHAASAGSRLSAEERSKPDMGKVTLTAKRFRAEVALDDDVVEDNVMGDRFINWVRERAVERIAADVDEIVIKSDTASADLDLKLFDGAIKAATSNIVNASSANLSGSILKQIQKAMPNAFLRDKRNIVFFTSKDAESDWRQDVRTRNTALGDARLLDDETVPFGGSPVVGCAMFPENPTNVIYTHKDNVLVGVWKQLIVEPYRDPRDGNSFLIFHIRFIFAYAEETAVVKANSVATTN